MTILPNPFDSGATDCAPDQAATPPRQSDGVVAEPSEIDHIGEIFIGARKLFDPDPAEYTSVDQLLYDMLKAMDNPHERDLPFIPDEDAFMSEVEDRPLFLRRA